MIGVHVRDHLRLGGDERFGAGQIGEQSIRLQIDDAAEAGDEMRALELHLVEREVAEAREHLGFRLVSEIAPARVRAFGLRRQAHQHHPRALQRIALLALVEHQRHARVGEDVLGVQRELRDQQQRRSVGCGRNVNQRTVRIA